MRCPTLSELPSPPSRKAGWPWTEESPQHLEALPDGSPWPRMSIVTPSYNQGQFIEETIRSVLLQGYSDLEYIVIDGGSTDSSVDVIHRYAPWLAYWVSEPDRGQAHAINKGFGRATGEIVAWLNSDDLYEPGTLQAVGQYARANPEAQLIYGNMWLTNAEGQYMSHLRGSYTREKLVHFYRGYYGISQPASFFRQSLLRSIGPLDESLHYILDYDLLLRASEVCKFHHVDRDITRFRLLDRSKTRAYLHRFAREHIDVAQRFISQLGVPNQEGYLREVRCHYAKQLVSSVFRQDPVDGRGALDVLREAGRLCPRLWKMPGFRHHLIKALVGSRCTRAVQWILKGMRSAYRAVR
jgi:glycosyltransferase involved in cell wall biosynthesis